MVLTHLRPLALDIENIAPDNMVSLSLVRIGLEFRLSDCRSFLIRTFLVRTSLVPPI